MSFGKLAAIVLALQLFGAARAEEFRCAKQLNGENLRGDFISEGDPKKTYFLHPEYNVWHIDHYDEKEAHYLVCFYGSNDKPSVVIELPKHVKYCIAEKKNEPVVCR